MKLKLLFIGNILFNSIFSYSKFRSMTGDPNLDENGNPIKEEPVIKPIITPVGTDSNLSILNPNNPNLPQQIIQPTTLNSGTVPILENKDQINSPIVEKDKNDLPTKISDSIYAALKDKILSIADGLSKIPRAIKKQKKAGILSEGFPKPFIKNARLNRDKTEKFMGILGYPTELYKFCVNPFAKVNYSKWCHHTFAGAQKKTTNCEYSFCAVCCDNLPFIYIYQAKNTSLGKKLDLDNEEGTKLIKNTLDTSEINSCRSVCQVIN